MSKPNLVLVTHPNDYKLFIHGVLSEHVQTADGWSLTVQEVELLRSNPKEFFAGSDNSDEPEAA